MPGEIALDSNTAIRYLNGDPVVVFNVTSRRGVTLPLIVVGELLFGAENSARPLENLVRYREFIQACTVVPLGRETAAAYARVRGDLKRKGRPIPDNDLWIAAQCVEHQWTLATDDEHFTYVADLSVERW